MEPIIEFRDFSFKYRAQKEATLKNINLAIYPGEKVLIVGPSGCGKSTLAHCINGLVPFSYEGEITGDYFIKGQKPKKLGIFGLSKIVGTVLQDTDGQFVGLTVAEDVAFALENDGVPREEIIKKVDEAAEMVDIKALKDHSPYELSGGQKQRVSIAGVVISDVDILLFDEPLANLDPATGKKTIELIDRLQKENNSTILIIEHRIEDALYKEVDRIIVLGDGKIVADTTPDELLTGSVLSNQGIREPLYITAMKYAGCEIKAEDMPASISKIKLDNYRDLLLSWFENTKTEKTKACTKKLLELNSVSFEYEKNSKVLDDICFSVCKGEMLAVVGKNGAGKTTLASLVCGFINPSFGNILLEGEDISSLSIKERGEHIGLVMQNPNQMISKPMIFDEVALGLVVRGVPEEKITEKVNEVLKVCGLYKMRNWPISALSYGQKKRVTIASILVMDPEIIILDEPTAGQDFLHYTEIMEFLKEINEKLGITIIMITHDMHLMLEYTNRALVLADGKLLFDGTPAEILSDDILTAKAYLKKTSLYDLAVGCGIASPIDFINRFISYERTKRLEVE